MPDQPTTALNLDGNDIVPIPAGAAIIKRIGWEVTSDGREFTAVLTFPNGPPQELMFGAVWNKTPVFLVEKKS